MHALTTSIAPEAMSTGLVFRLTDGQVDHPTPPGDDDDDKRLRNKPQPDVPERDEAQPGATAH